MLHSSQVGALTITGESSVGSGVRRLEAFVGMDALPLTGHTIPALTSVRSPLPEMAGLMVDRIMRRMEDASLPPEQFSFPPSLVLRDSVAPLVTAGA